MEGTPTEATSERIVERHAVLFVPGQFATIQSAIEAVVGPATIMIEPGLYYESIRVRGKSSLVIESTRLTRRGVTLAGDDGDDGGSVVSADQSTLHLSGLEIRSRRNRRGIDVTDGTLSLQDCVVAGHRLMESASDAAGAGMRCRRSRVRIQKSTVAGNTVETPHAACGAGIYFNECAVEIAGSSIQLNAIYGREGRGGGIWCEQSSMRMWRSRVTDNAIHASVSEGGGIFFQDARDCQLGGSVITGNGSPEGRGGGVFMAGNRSGIRIHGNTFIRQNHPDDIGHI